MRQKNYNTSSVLRKGAWTTEEDILLRNCIDKFGEGKWHLVPHRAGLSRCRKSCRLRWLNYLRPNIKRGDFGEDEVDLMCRLHKLLGNRWSLIAGRIPGRTANDVKNYWNTNFKSRPKQQKAVEHKDGEPPQHTMVTPFKPQPRKFPKALNLHPHITNHDTCNMLNSSNNRIDNISNACPGLVTSPTLSNDKIKEYLDELFAEPNKETDDQVGWCFGGFSEREGLHVAEQKQDGNSLFDFPIDDVVMWDLIDSNQL